MQTSLDGTQVDAGCDLEVEEDVGIVGAEVMWDWWSLTACENLGYEPTEQDHRRIEIAELVDECNDRGLGQCTSVSASVSNQSLFP
jgi:hypothetical protein